jgi:putative membrane protein
VAQGIPRHRYYRLDGGNALFAAPSIIVEPGSKQSETFKVMERRLLVAIINPAMIVSWGLGLWLSWKGGWYASHWLQAKVVLALALSGLHGFFVRWVRDFAADQNQHSQKFYRIINEVPTILMIGIVILVVVKPF